MKVQLVTVGLLECEFSIAPPLKKAEFPLNVQPVIVGLLWLELFIPPPLGAEFPVNVQFVTIGLDEVLYIPPP